MSNKVPTFDVIIIGGSHAGLSAALLLGRSLRKTLIIDGGKPRNEPSPEAHSLYTRDGQDPMALLKIGKEQLTPYKTISFESGFVREARKTREGFEVEHNGQKLATKIVILATGLNDQMPDVPGFKELWGKKVLHCPFCHGFEAMGLKIGYVGKPGAVANANTMYGHWYDDLIMVTNDQEFTPEDVQVCKASKVPLLEGKIVSLSDTDNGLAVITNKGEISLGRLYLGTSVKTQQRTSREIRLRTGAGTSPWQGPVGESRRKLPDNGRWCLRHRRFERKLHSGGFRHVLWRQSSFFAQSTTLGFRLPRPAAEVMCRVAIPKNTSLRPSEREVEDRSPGIARRTLHQVVLFRFENQRHAERNRRHHVDP